MLDAMLAATDAMAIGAIEERLDKLAARMGKFDKAATIAMLGGLLTDPGLQANAVRFEVLIHLVALRAEGHVRPTAAKLREWLNDILGEDDVGHQEDPPEDVFVSNVVSGAGNSLLFEGIWEANAAYVQAALYAVTACLREGRVWAGHFLRQASALLNLGTAVANRSGLRRNDVGGGRRLGRIQFPTKKIEGLANRVRFTPAALLAIGIDPFDLSPFIFDPEKSGALRNETISWTSLEARPIIKVGEDFIVALPTAIGAAIRRRALDMALGNGDGDLFQEKLTDYQFGNCVTSARLGLDLTRVEGPEADAVSGFVNMICRFDLGAYAHVLFIQDDVGEIAVHGFRSVRDVSVDVRRLAAAGIAKIKAMSDFRMGMTIVVFGGLGRAFIADPGPIPREWRFVGLGCEDLELFADESRTSALQMFRLLGQERELLLANTQLVNPNGFLNLYGFVEKHDFEILPEYVERGRSLVPIPIDCLTSVRTKIRKALDKHAVRVEPRQAYVEVRRPSTEMYFADLAEEPSYVSVADAMEGRPAAAIEAAGRTWWLTIADTQPVASGDLSYRVWDMARNWIVMLAPKVAEAAPTLPAFIDVELSFPDGIDLSPERIADGAELIRPVVNIDGEAIRIDCGIDYLRAFGRSENVGDRWIVEAIADSALSIAGSTDSDLAATIATSIVGDRSSRHLHVLTPKTAGEFVLATADLPKPRFLQPEVRAWADIGMAQRAGVPVGDFGIVENKVDARKITNGAVDALWKEIRARLETIDRTSVIEKCIDNHNAIDRDRATWRHTAAAVLQLHRREDVMKAAVERESARSEVSLCCRVAIEMAVCVSPVAGGYQCSLDDLDYVLARISLLNGMASRGDEIHYGFAKRIEIKPSGVIRFEDEFSNQVHTPFIVALSQDQFEAAAEGYDAFYEPTEEIDDAEYEQAKNPEFESAFVAEYGITPDRMVDFVSILCERAITSGNGRVILPRSELKADLVAMDGVDTTAAEAFLSSWCLIPRDKWDDPKPNGASAKDWYPWRFARRLSLLSRPIVQLTAADDPLCIVSPVIADHGLEYALRSYNAKLPDAYFRSPAMRTWVGGAIDRLGHAFNHRVAARLKELGLEAEAEYLMTRLGGTAADGDVDTLAWNPTSGDVYIIECKRLLADKTVGEIAERLVEYGPDHVQGGKRGPTRKHLDRVAVLNSKLPQLATATGIPIARIRMRSCLVTSALVPMQFQREAANHFDVVVAYDGLEREFSPGQDERPPR